MTDDDALIALAAARKLVWGEAPHTKRTEISDAIDKAAARIAALTAEIAELDPPPEHCGCREALCPHIPIRKQSRKELGEHWRKMIALERDRATKAEAALAERDKDAERLDKIESCIRDGSYLSILNDIIAVCQHSYATIGKGPALRTAIDAAIRESKP